MTRIAFTALCYFAIVGAAQAASPLAACKKSKFKEEFHCSQKHVNPKSLAVGTCGKTQVVSTYQSGVAGVTMVSQEEVKRAPTAHPGMSATFTKKGFNLWLNMTDGDAKGFPAELARGKTKEEFTCTRGR